ncbi:MAG: hypothetical protein JWM73_2697, partial [Solirubrobacterales bacterium]|nr:hypothetical protein [Solirubrobacterales bacterium]
MSVVSSPKTSNHLWSGDWREREGEERPRREEAPPVAAGTAVAEPPAIRRRPGRAA